MAENTKDDGMLEALFKEAAKDSQADPSAAFLARVLADAETMQPVVQPVVQRVAAPVGTSSRRSGVLRQLLQAIGGWPSLAGLAAATVAGVWIGFSASTTLLPNGVTGLIQEDNASYLAYLGTDYTFTAEEG